MWMRMDVRLFRGVFHNKSTLYGVNVCIFFIIILFLQPHAFIMLSSVEVVLWARRQVFSSCGFYYLCENSVVSIKASFNKGGISILWALWDLTLQWKIRAALPWDKNGAREVEHSWIDRCGILSLFQDFPHFQQLSSLKAWFPITRSHILR